MVHNRRTFLFPRVFRPVSSMDSQALFHVSSLVRTIIEHCAKNASLEEDPPLIEDSRIKQVFVLTHNVYFHSNVTNDYEDKYRYVSFHKVTKSGNVSRTKLCEKETTKGNFENYNPIANAYTALWCELEEVRSALTACNVIERILVYYFLNLCGTKGDTLTKAVLEGEGKDRLSANPGQYEIAKAFLMYANSPKDKVFNEICIEDDWSLGDCRDTMKLIFEIMGQEEHYDILTKSFKKLV